MSGLLNPPGRICGCEWCDTAAAFSQPGDLERIIRRTTPEEPVIAVVSGRIEAAPSGGGTPTQGLTHSLDPSKEGLGMKSTRDEHVPVPGHPKWPGSRNQYQRRAQDEWLNHHPECVYLPWAWVSTSCGVDMCMNVDCMEIHRPVKIAYPPGVCVYCGDPAGTMDHLLPRTWTSTSARRSVAVVPACAQCNSTLSDIFEPSVYKRREYVQARYAKRWAKRLAVADPTKEDLARMGYVLRDAAIRGIAQRERLRLRLAWPEDPFYDKRAFEKSGIEDPETLGVA